MDSGQSWRQPLCRLYRESAGRDTLGRRPKELVMREARLSTESLQPLHSCKPVRLPIARRKVDSLVKVEAVVEARVVSLREGDDELSSPLIKGVHTHAGLLQLFGGE